MNPIYFVVLSSILGYVGGANVFHSCDPLAINTHNSGDREGLDDSNQVLPISEFLMDKEINYYLARATPNLESASTASAAASKYQFCHVLSHNKGCGPLHYHQKLFDDYKVKKNDKGKAKIDEAKPGESLEGLRFRMTSIGMSLENGNAIKFEMDVVGTNADDYIFKWDEDTEIKAHEILPNNELREIEVIPDNVLDSLKSEFAINFIYIVEDEGEDYDKRLYSIYVTCDGKSIWASYNKPVVDQDNEGVTASLMESKIKDLQGMILQLELQPSRVKVKPVSTYVPARFDALVPIPQAEPVVA